jgi:uncharacterized membrane protein
MLKNLLKKYKKNATELTPTIKWISFLGLIFSTLGIADTVYLTITHYSTTITLACPDTGFINCQKVTTSSYSEILGVPVALLGLLFFVAMLIVQTPWSWRLQTNFFRISRLVFSSTGILFVLWLLYVEFHLLHNICLYCTGVHILTFAIFVVTLIGTAIISQELQEKA